MDIHTFNFKQKAAQMRACEFVSRWLRQNNTSCSNICFDRYLVSPGKDFFKYHVRAVNTSSLKTYFFELSCQGSNLEISYLHDSDDPSHLGPGESNFLSPESLSMYGDAARMQ